MDTVNKIKYIYKGNEPAKEIKPIIEDLFSNVYNPYCDVTSLCFEQWNREYVGPDDRDDYHGEYSTYIRGKLEPIVIMINGYWEKNSLKVFIKRFLIGEELDFEAELMDGTIMSFVLVPEE